MDTRTFGGDDELHGLRWPSNRESRHCDQDAFVKPSHFTRARRNLMSLRIV